MLRRWALGLGVLLFACGNVRDSSEPGPGSGGAPPGGNHGSGAAPGSGAGAGYGGQGSGGSVQIGGHFGAGGIAGTGGLILGIGGKSIDPPMPWPYEPQVPDADGGGLDGGVCPTVPSAPVHECVPKRTAGTSSSACYGPFGGFSTLVVIQSGFPLGCRVALPEPAASGCGPRLCTCTPDVQDPGGIRPFADWVCGP